MWYLLIFLLIPSLIGERICYHCISRLDDSIGNKNEKDLLKTVLFSRFNVPPSSDYCAIGGTDLLFQTVDKKICRNETDKCINIASTVEQNRTITRLVIRGCQQELMKTGYHLKHSAFTELINVCDSTLCNYSSIRNIFNIFTCIFFITLL